MKWIVFWTLVHSFATGCPPNDIYDDYGRLISTDRGNLSVCYEEVEDTKCKRFSTKRDAEKFIAEADNDTFGLNYYKLKEFNIVEADLLQGPSYYCQY